MSELEIFFSSKFTSVNIKIAIIKQNINSSNNITLKKHLPIRKSIDQLFYAAVIAHYLPFRGKYQNSNLPAKTSLADQLV